MESWEFLLARIAEDEIAIRSRWNAAGVTDEAFWGTPFQPSRALAECEAKRRILDIDIDSGFHPANREILAAMVFPYRNHPDYNSAWAL